MPVLHILNETYNFPSVEDADEQGLLALGGDLKPERLLTAYRNGIFPWFMKDEPILWWSPDPRFVLYPQELKVSKSMKQVFKNQLFTYQFNTNFKKTIENCAAVIRNGQDDTWITNDMIEAYCTLHNRGYAVSAEAYQNNKLVGGLYGIRMGNIFFGESMFSYASNASKFAFISFVKQLQHEGVVLIDSQVYTPHLESLGAKMISRDLYIETLRKNI